MVTEVGNKENKKSRKSKRKEKTKIPRYFILISTIMTWAFTKPLDPEDPDLPFTEVDYRKRRAHPNFKEHLRCERDVVIVKKRVDLKQKLKTIVICCGITYGEEQNGLHYLFKMAWLNEPFLPIIGNGKNRIPLLHVRDLISIVRDVIQNWPTLRYIVAVEQGIISQSAIVKVINYILLICLFFLKLK
ncbi:adenylate kinase 7-like [Polistes fuscatus]|uniref:adenylate kinase 7-like n=1 Tax=Polistes fuscatus TaxID=30207 RepID=UPI001CA8F816|nr:adenylate kinase 7-like [Polistes fuscatus]